MQTYWDDIQPEDEISPLPKVATTQTLIKWAGASGDLNPLHYDERFAAGEGVERPIVHGALKRQWLLHLVTAWAGEGGTLRKFSCRYRAIDYPRHMKTTSEAEDGDTWWCKGRVKKKYIQDGEHFVDCEVWVENGTGEVTTSGKATVIMPARANS